MKNEAELVLILDNIKAATPPPPEMLPPEQRSLFYMPVPEWRRAMNLGRLGRLDKFEEMARMLGERTGTPSWIARMAMDAAIPTDHEHELDDPENDAPALERAASAMGLDPMLVSWSAPNSH